jgi:hypothetical protein
MKAWSLEAVIDPVSTEDFFSAYFESQRLLVRRNRPDFFEELLTLDDVDRILTTAQSTREEVAVVNAANKIKTADYVYGNDRSKSISCSAFTRPAAPSSSITCTGGTRRWQDYARRSSSSSALHFRRTST